MSDNSVEHAVRIHYDTESGVGNAYKLLANWQQVINVILFDWENALDHPALIHYALDYKPGADFNCALKKSTYEIFALLKVTKGKILDAGCGVGGATILLAQDYPNIEFIGVSLSREQIDIAKKRAEKKGITNVRYFTANYLNLPIPSESVDGIMASETLCHIKDLDKPILFKELNRILKKNGTISVFDAYLNNRPTSKMYMPQLHTKVFRGWTLPDKISTIPFFLKEAKKAGFTVIKAQEITQRIMGCAQEARRRMRLFKPFKRIIDIIIKLKKKGIKLPVVSHLGLDHEAILAFGNTAELQYEMFASRDVEYWVIVLTKK